MTARWAISVVAKLRSLRRFAGARARYLAVLALVALTLAKPTWTLNRDAYDYVAFIDITQSMNVPDYELDGRPASRLAFVKAALKESLTDLPCGSRLGLGIFTQYRVVLLVEPIETCGNYHELMNSLDQIDGRMAWANGSEIAKGLFWALRNIQDIGGTHNLVFFTDGQEAPPLNPSYRPIFAGSTAQGRPYTYLDQTTWQQRPVYEGKAGDIKGLIVGVGGDTPKPIPKLDADGQSLGYWQAHDVMQTDVYSSAELHDASGVNASTSSKAILPTLTEHLSSLRGEHLQALASDGGLRYHRLQSVSGFVRAMKSGEFAHPEPRPADLRIPLAMLALALLLIPYAGRVWLIARDRCVKAISLPWSRKSSSNR